MARDLQWSTLDHIRGILNSMSTSNGHEFFEREELISVWELLELLVWTEPLVYKYGWLWRDWYCYRLICVLAHTRKSNMKGVFSFKWIPNIDTNAYFLKLTIRTWTWSHYIDFLSVFVMFDCQFFIEIDVLSKYSFYINWKYLDEITSWKNKSNNI